MNLNDQWLIDDRRGRFEGLALYSSQEHHALCSSGLCRLCCEMQIDCVCDAPCNFMSWHSWLEVCSFFCTKHGKVLCNRLREGQSGHEQVWRDYETHNCQPYAREPRDCTSFT
ncbi:hypothetical protein BVRB_9g219720 [Beta vulgaris subsp. vulgaris]|nr:hypothetical protein BVRB_9g219720 [Beta vulgaris subsp. vulgaris]